jgi:chorismate mutase
VRPVASEHPDPVIRQLREQISDNDRALVQALNRRLELVARLKAYKESRGVEFLDPAREEWMLRYLARANRGPLSAEGLREIYSELLDLTKREVARAEEDPRDPAAASPRSSTDTR